jgi:preprotein translocase subunit YajC
LGAAPSGKLNVKLAKRGSAHRFVGSKLKKMNFIGLFGFLAYMPPAPAGTQVDPKAQMLQMLGTFAVLGVMFYFVMIRPQQKKSKEHAELLKAIKPGDKVLTSGGILAVVVSVKEKSVSIRSADSKLEILKSAVSEITEKASGPTES